jgi:hypothetical protein
MSDHRDRGVEVRIEALRAAVSVASPADNVWSVLVHTQALCQFLETGIAPKVETESTIARRVPVA